MLVKWMSLVWLLSTDEEEEEEEEDPELKVVDEVIALVWKTADTI